MYIDVSTYESLMNNSLELPLGDTPILIIDHLTGFGSSFGNDIFDWLSEHRVENPILTQYVISKELAQRYPKLSLHFSVNTQNNINFNHLLTYKIHPKVNIKNFICSFNGSEHVSRKLLTAILYKFGYFNTNYCSKNYTHSVDTLDGHISDYTGINDTYYRKFFISEESETFFQKIYSFGHVRFDHANNIYNLENKLTESFVHIVSETMGTSYYPFVTEKFLYSVVTRGLFLSYAQPGWHAHIEKYYGFKLYTKLFDYRFDTIKNPIERLVELMTMVSKFSKLSYDDLYDIYLLELDTINHNYEHYFSGRYLEHLKQYDTNI